MEKVSYLRQAEVTLHVSYNSFDNISFEIGISLCIKSRAF